VLLKWLKMVLFAFYVLEAVLGIASAPRILSAPLRGPAVLSFSALLQNNSA